MPKFRLDRLKFKKPVFKNPVVVVEIGNDWLKIIENSYRSGDRYITKINFSFYLNIT